MKSCFRDVSVYVGSSVVEYSHDCISLPPHRPTKGIERHLLPGGGRRGQYLKVHIHLSQKCRIVMETVSYNYCEQHRNTQSCSKRLQLPPSANTLIETLIQRHSLVLLIQFSYSVKGEFSLSSQFQKGSGKAYRRGTGCVTE